MTLSVRNQSWIAAGVFVLLAALTIFEPFPEPAQTIMQAAIFLPTAAWAFYISRNCRDEVMIHASRAAFAHGVPIGAGIVVAAVLVMRYWAPATDFVVAAANRSANELPPEAVGFGFGAMFTLMAVGLTVTAIYAIWWARAR